MCGERFKFVWSSLELCASHLGDFLSNGLCESLVGVDSSSNCGTTLCKQTEVWERRLHTLDAKIELCNVSGELLSESKRCGILKMCSSNLNNLLGFEVADLCLEGRS